MSKAPEPLKPPKGIYGEIGPLDWSAIEACIKRKSYIVSDSIWAEMNQRNYREGDVDEMVDTGFLHQITHYNPSKRCWKVRWFGFDNAGLPRFCTFAYFEVRTTATQWELISVSEPIGL